MSYPLMRLLTDVVLPLLIPVLIIATRHRAGGAIIASSVLALAIFCLLGFSIGRAAGSDGILNVSVLQLHFFLYSGGDLAALSGWTLALYETVRAQRRQWVAGLTAAGVGSWLALYLASGVGPCVFAALFIPSTSCAPFSPALLVVVFLFVLAGPATTLVYGLRVHRHGQRESISPPGGPDAVLAGEQAEDTDVELEIRAERL